MARILVADDEPGLREFVADALELDAHVCVPAPDGRVAAKLLDERGFDLVITDLKMPGLDGMGLLRKVRAEQPEVEVIVMTAHGTVDNAVEAMKLGAFEYLQKPLSGPDELRLLVARAIERRGLRDRVHGESTPDGPPLTYGDPVMAPVTTAIDKVAKTSATVLLLGESGTGKEVAARAIHAHRRGPQKAVHGDQLRVRYPRRCSRVSCSVMRRARSPARPSAGARRLELADGGTFFLDEVGELKAELQAKLLRVLQERRFERVGGSRTLEVDVRWVAATNRDLRAMIETGKFREDLYHRLAVFPIKLPPLRERKSDLLPIAKHLVARIAADLKQPVPVLTPAAEQRLLTSSWRGNVRELANALERAAILADGATIDASHIWIDEPAPTSSRPVGEGGIRPLAELELDAILQALEAVGGNRRRAAELLGFGERSLYDRLKKYGVVSRASTHV